MEMISESLRVLRKNKGLTQKELSEKVGVTEQAISNWERGKSYPSLDIIHSLINILDCSPNDIFGYQEGEKNFNRIINPRLTDIVESGITPDIIKLEFGEKLTELFTDENHKGIKALQELRVTMAHNYGIILPLIRLRDITEIAEHDYRVSIRTKEVALDTVYPTMKWGCGFDVHDNDIKAKNPINGLDISWTEREEDNLTSPVETIMTHLEYIILKNFDRIISLQYVSDVIEVIAKRNPVIKNYIVPHRVSFQLLKKVLSKLVVEKECRINELVDIIETIDDVNDTSRDVDEIVNIVSERLEKFSFDKL